MTAIAYPGPPPRREGRPDLRVVPPPARRRSPRSRAAVYRRRRVAVLVMVAVLFFAARAALAGLGGGPLTAPEAPTSGRPAVTYVVRPGDTWWSIARALHPSGDLRATVDRLVAAHGGVPLQAGERVALN